MIKMMVRTQATIQHLTNTSLDLDVSTVIENMCVFSSVLRLERT
jgi:hypothetical protein